MDQELKVLVVEDENHISDVIKAYLEKEGYQVTLATNGKEALKEIEQSTVNFVILDLMLPDLSGEEVCQKIRLQSQVPILMLTAKVAEEDRVYGLNIGADDYLVKPFSPKELIARVKAILRRHRNEGIIANIISFNNKDLKIHIDRREVFKQEKLVELTNTEFKILALLAQNPGKVFSREELVTKILGYDYEGYERTIDTHIKNIRQKTESKERKYIVTVYGAGYKFVGE
ncbi:response regulator transcription factor [Serpentinicella sp. ANB-PHB4]|uniref:response regulator transcription factor n=1 Tax=Serpentinicella sp. ANB-PHB4 TaxID=3074076 RepID=UPI0028650F71|nr:response regulator transcription factor [Serpentinicella sp. ANB-PHB4]MDR5659285.1 response regulator transcription factor [Serpentinicella sp. ANB-PHB4]